MDTIGTLTVRHNNPHLADQVIKGVRRGQYEGLAYDIALGEHSSLGAYDIVTCEGVRVSLVKKWILSVTFTPTG